MAKTMRVHYSRGLQVGSMGEGDTPGTVYPALVE